MMLAEGCIRHGYQLPLGSQQGLKDFVIDTITGVMSAKDCGKHVNEIYFNFY